MKDLTWKHVSIAVAFLSAVTVLALTRNDTGALITVGMAILAGVGWAGTKATEAKAESSVVREQTNGNMHRMLDMLGSMSSQLASMQPPPPVTPEADEKPTTGG